MKITDILLIGICGIVIIIVIVGVNLNISSVNNIGEFKDWKCKVSFDINKDLISGYKYNYHVNSFEVEFPCKDNDVNTFLNTMSREIGEDFEGVQNEKA